jgi:alpha-L-rhamnosidase
METQMTSENMTARFASAQPIWPVGREKEMNLLVDFWAVVELPAGVPQGDAVLRVAASSVYRAFVDSRFVGHGPAIGPHGFYRVDEWPLGALAAGEHVVAIEVASYNVNGFYLINQPGFVQAEVLAGERVLACTGDGGFEARILPERIQRVQRSDFQRPFVEVYAMGEDFDRWRRDPDALGKAAPCRTQDSKKLLPRRVKLPRFETTPPRTLLRSGTSKAVAVTKPWRDRSLAGIGPQLLGFTMDQLEVALSDELQAIGVAGVQDVNAAYAPQTPLDLAAGEFHILVLSRCSIDG